MKLRKRGNRIFPIHNTALFRHCSGGNNSVTEKEYPDLEQILLHHNVNYINVIDEDEDEEVTTHVLEG
jgi:Ni,Fe-hydrogenase I small subunit